MTMTDNYTVGSFIYDPKVYDGLNKQQDDLAFYLKWIADNGVSKVLEVCCGTGRLTIPLAKAGINVSGFDLNGSMLKEAENKATKEKLSIPLHQGDMRSMALDDHFQMVFIPFNSIHCLYGHDDVINTLRSIHGHLEEKGKLIIDYFNPDISYITGNQGKAVEIANYVTEDGRAIRIIQKMNYEDGTQINRIKWEYSVNGLPHSEESLDMRMFYPQELDYYIKSNGYEIVRKYGDYEMTPFTNGSPLQLIVCQKV